MKALIATASIALLLGSTPAVGHDVSKHDGNEPDLKVDIKQVLYAHPGRRAVLKTTMRDELTKYHVTHGLIGWALDTKGNATPDYSITSQYDFENHYTCAIYAIHDNEFVANVDGSKGDDFYECTFRRNLVSGIAEHFSSFASYNGHTDDAPDMLMYKHPDD